MTFIWFSDFKDDTPKDFYGRKQCTILALDARRFPKPEEQYTKEMVDRELNKVNCTNIYYNSVNLTSHKQICMNF
ncbi:unnamed protein product, partial [Brenthis ino]